MSWNEFLPELAVKHEVLETLYEDIGTPAGEKTKECQSLFDKFMVVMDEHIHQAQQTKERFVQECEQLLDDIKRMTGLVGQAEEGITKLIRALDGMSLWSRHALLREEYGYIFEHYTQRLEEIRELHGKLTEYATILGPSYVQPGPFPEEGAAVSFDVVQQFSDNIAACEEEQKRRISVVESTIIAIKHLWNELGLTPQDAFEREVIASEHDQVPISDETIRRLEMKQTMLEDERSKRERLVKDHLAEITRLWDKLRIEDDDREEFVASHVGLDMDNIRAYKSELNRLEELKSQKLEEFILEERDNLYELWDKLYYSLDQRESFAPVFDNNFTDENLAIHEAEVARLLAEVEENEHILNAIEKYRRMLDDFREFEITAMDAQRLFHRDPGRLLREEKFRNRMAREFPKAESELEEALYQWQQSKGRPFLVYGEEYINTMKLHAQQAREGKENEKLWREHRKHLSLQRDLRYGSQNPKKVAPNSPHPRRISPSIVPSMDSSGRRSPTLPQTPTSKRIIQSINRPGTPGSHRMRAMPPASPTTPTRARSHTLSLQPSGHNAVPHSPHSHHSLQQQWQSGLGSKFYSRSESPATSFSLKKQPSTPSKHNNSISKRSNSIISISSTTTEVFAAPSTPSRSSRVLRPISLDLTGQDDETHSTPRRLKRSAADLSSPIGSPPNSPSTHYQRRRSRSASPHATDSTKMQLAQLGSPFVARTTHMRGREGLADLKRQHQDNPLMRQFLEIRDEQEHEDREMQTVEEEDQDSVVELNQSEAEKLFSNANKVVTVVNLEGPDHESDGWETENDDSPRSRKQSKNGSQGSSSRTPKPHNATNNVPLSG
ncbi:hypothetical protein BGZ51_007487 [Haplosporangium sp. Z 767]|nr:hypothetical protein BGZ51_007487 [Haplosporangium sp. Z 767]KAF9194153.1 hypothetical protein BGZ50_006632 [Haplosporangium sp. Z 11]